VWAVTKIISIVKQPAIITNILFVFSNDDRRSYDVRLIGHESLKFLRTTIPSEKEWTEKKQFSTQRIQAMNRPTNRQPFYRPKYLRTFFPAIRPELIANPAAAPVESLMQ